jgi:hypothetical protein
MFLENGQAKAGATPVVHKIMQHKTERTPWRKHLLEPKLGQKSARQAQNLTIRHRKADEFNL